MREQPRKALAGALIVLAIAATVWLTFGEMWALLSIVFLFVSLNRFFLPTTFTVDAKSITARYPLKQQRLRWADVRRFVYDENGGYLSTRSQPSRLDAYSGMHLLFGEPRDEVITRIHACLQAAPSPVESVEPAAAPSRPQPRVPVGDGGAP